ncbi:S8 family peptidase [Sphingomonas sp. SRS2]|uniref:S8 family peptidase n=1 Tax=Sphingomonas sp. SRS2 TaxID=133190 RepID=UPI000695FD4F|nr:S8 family peptidase [Sphingomonas sp. SRS2]
MIHLLCRALPGLVLACTLAAPSFALSSFHGPDRPDPGSLEYRLSWGIDQIDGARLYRKGTAGSGITVAMIDTGLSGASREMFARLSPASIDLKPGRVQGDSGADHGRQTAELLAAARDGAGTVGVAYDATLLAIRADLDGSCQRICSMTGEDLARGIDYAVAHGARVIGLPLASKMRLPTIEPALERAVQAGVLVVAAAGNDGDPEPTWPARYAADPRFTGSILVAGASTAGRELARWSNKAGSTAHRYLLAPGEHVLVDCDSRYCGAVSGTSYSVSYVAGAAALLLGRHPALSGSDAADLLLAGAKDARRPAPSSGRGSLDVARAVRLADRATG